MSTQLPSFLFLPLCAYAHPSFSLTASVCRLFVAPFFLSNPLHIYPCASLVHLFSVFLSLHPSLFFFLCFSSDFLSTSLYLLFFSLTPSVLCDHIHSSSPPFSCSSIFRSHRSTVDFAARLSRISRLSFISVSVFSVLVSASVSFSPSLVPCVSLHGAYLCV